MKNFVEIFKDNSEYNEKTIIGFLSFSVMTLYSVVDLITGVLDINLALHEYIYNSFLILTLGSFGIAGLEKFSPTSVKHAESSNTKNEE